jgi:SAM-dependent methyltransferase
MVANRLRARIRASLDPRRSKAHHELRYWRSRAASEGDLGNAHYAELFTSMFGLDRSFYAGKRVLDIGCGPRGSLEWADEAAQRVGLDPLAEKYKQFGTDRHAMEYVSAGVERMPFPDGSFDIVTSLNSLDHVDDLDAALEEIARITAPGGSFLLEVEIGHAPTHTEPLLVWFDIFDKLASSFTVVADRRYELPADGAFTHEGWVTGWGGPFDMGSGVHPGVLVAHWRRRADEL